MIDYAKELLDLEYPTGVRLSPDAMSVVYSAKPKWKSTEEVSSIWVGNTQSHKSTHSEYIAFLSDRGNLGNSCALYLCRLDGQRETKALTPPTNKKSISKFEFSPDGKHIAFLAAAEKEQNEVVDVWNQGWDYANLHLIDIESGSTRVLAPEDVHVVDFSWSEDGSQMAYVTHRSPDIESGWLHGATISTVEIAAIGVGARTLCHVPREVSDLTWIRSDIYFIAYSTPTDINTSRSVYSVNLLDKDKSVTKVAHGVDDCAAGLRKVGGDLLVHVQRGMEDQLRLLNSTILYREKKCILSFDATVDVDGKIGLVFVQGSVNRPPEVFWTSPAGDLAQLSNHGKVWTKEYNTCTFIECQTLDGTEKLEGMFLGPANATEKSVPTIVLIHGGPYWRVTDSFNFLDHFFMPQLLHKGFGILIPNYRGSSGRGERFARYSSGGMGIYDEPDIVAMTQYVITQKLADPLRLIVAGKSQGGFLSYLLSVRNGTHGLGWRFQGAIACAGVTDWDTMSMSSDIGYAQADLAGGAPWNIHKSDVRTRAGSAIWEFRDAARERRIPPMLLLHGNEDKRVPISQAVGFRRALDEVGLPFQFAVYRGEGHFFQKRKSAEDLMERIVRFVTKTLA
ncbi:acylamino-acid-releasing enzyme, putative [Talaromyces stipitatus ATCC 10500]|uniref:Dipeptidyl-peptidase V n=1 Tax=Talaromyces stipitatus (strain ATCC 10500 / CBS 375.48 / QM 6759 / NRRL 1006) TaxID=441959 RepID=B8MM36_TALSN|nr:acylamino-acid-releasing enzyme, putative [Talaromyces stipitatus ATCC 10500]EED13548.1 acylamino-acid-releasing enzyme, putative [Talaromyces stipitatus ATCC 10500]